MIILRSNRCLMITEMSFTDEKRELHVLVAELWLDWIQDESSMLSDGGSRHEIIFLFERATKDYQCK